MNSTKLVSEKIPNYDEVYKDIRNFIKNNFSELAVDFLLNNDNYSICNWIIKYKDYDKIQIWYDAKSKYNVTNIYNNLEENKKTNKEWINFIKNINPNSNSLIIDHCPRHDLFWFFLEEIKNFLAKKYNCTILCNDEIVKKDNYVFFDNYFDWKENYLKSYNNPEIMMGLCIFYLYLDIELEMPEDLKKYIKGYEGYFDKYPEQVRSAESFLHSK